MSDAEAVIRRFVSAFTVADFDTMRRLLADDLTAYVTNSTGGVDRVDGRDGYLARIPDLASDHYSVTVTQSVTVAPDQALTMVEIHAERGGKTLHNHAAYLSLVQEGQVTELWMVEALPARSDDFWS